MLIFLLPLAWLTAAEAAALIAVYVLVALWVSFHVLLHKDDVRAALGWIGIAWFAPFLGGALYYLFGINRVTRRALRFRTLDRERGAPDGEADTRDFPQHIACLAAMNEQVTQSPLSGGNAMHIMHGGDNAYPVMLDAISNARHSIAMSAYILRIDKVGKKFIEALCAAHARGVAVRVLLDGVGIGYFLSRSWRRLRRCGVPTARFLHTWVPWRMPFLNMRNHKKLLVIDGRVAFAGGLNIGAENCRDYPHEQNRVDDFHARLDGPAVRHVMDSIARDWVFTTGEKLQGELWWPQIARTGDIFVRGMRSGPDADIFKSEMVLGAALSQARHRVRIATPYFLPDERLLFAIEQARLRGVTIEILIPLRTDYRFIDWAVRAHLRFFDKMLDCIFFTPPPFEHAKLMTVDGQWALMGSTNWDTRSLRLNFEFDLECYSEAFAAAVDDQIDRMLKKSTPVDRDALSGAPRWQRLRDAAARLFLPYL